MISIPNAPACIIMFRHGESEYNRAVQNRDHATLSRLKHVSETRIGLSSKGLQQAMQLGKWMKIHASQPDFYLTSSYDRAKQTLREVLTSTKWVKKPILRVQALCERNWGYFSMLTEEEWENQQYLGTWHARKTQEPNWQPPGGQTLVQVKDDSAEFLANLPDVYEDKCLLLSTHGERLTAIRALLEEWNDERFRNEVLNNHPKHCQVYIYQWSAQQKRYQMIRTATPAYK